MGLKLVTAPAKEPVLLTEMKEYLRVDDASLNLTIGGLIAAARIYCENFQSRAYVSQTWDMTLDNYPDAAVNPVPLWQLERVYTYPYSFNRFPGTSEPLRVPKAPLQSVEFIRFTDDHGAVTTWPASNYIVDIDSEPGRIALVAGASWPNTPLQPIAGVRIRFLAGYGAETDVPQNVKQAIMLWVAHRFENPTSENVPPAVHHLLWQDRLAEMS